MLSNIKRRAICLFVFIAVFTGNTVYATDGSGTVVEVMVCTGDQNGNAGGVWTEMGLFKLSDGQWFGTWINNVKTTRNPDSTAIFESAREAFLNDTQVSVRATFANYTVCGVTADFLWDIPGDYFKMVKMAAG